MTILEKPQLISSKEGDSLQRRKERKRNITLSRLEKKRKKKTREYLAERANIEILQPVLGEGTTVAGRSL